MPGQRIVWVLTSHLYGISEAARVQTSQQEAIETDGELSSGLGALAKETNAASENINSVLDLAAKIEAHEQEIQQAHMKFNSEEMAWEEYLSTDHIGFGSTEWVNLTAGDDVTAEDESELGIPANCITSQGGRSQWVGTAPWCAASRSDCADLGMSYVRSSSSGGGSSCWSGTKVLCQERGQRRRKDECNPECTYQMRQWFIGTAPACGASDCDCIRSNGYTLLTQGSYRCPCNNRRNCANFGASCVTGQKALCVNPGSLDVRRAAAARQRARQDCTTRDRIASENLQAIAGAITSVAEAAGSIATAR